MNLFSKLALAISTASLIAIITIESGTFFIVKTTIESWMATKLPTQQEINQEAMAVSGQIFPKLLLFQTIATIALGTGYLFFQRKTITDPISNLTRATNGIAQGNLDQQIPVLSNDEIGVLTKDFNRMVVQLKASYDALDEKVKQRTKELDQKVAELEKMNEIMVDREIAMVELKKKLKTLNPVLGS